MRRTPGGRVIYGTAVDARGLICRVQGAAVDVEGEPLALLLICEAPGRLRGSAYLTRDEARELAAALMLFADGAA